MCAFSRGLFSSVFRPLSLDWQNPFCRLAESGCSRTSACARPPTCRPAKMLSRAAWLMMLLLAACARGVFSAADDGAGAVGEGASSIALSHSAAAAVKTLGPIKQHEKAQQPAVLLLASLAVLAPRRAGAALLVAAVAVGAQAATASAPDPGLQRLLGATGYSASSLYSNVAAVASCGTTAASVVGTTPLYSIPIYNMGSPPQSSWDANNLQTADWDWSWSSISGAQNSVLPCVALLSNGCIFSQQSQPPNVPFFCPPAALGTRFLSVQVIGEAVGGVTDTGNLVFFGAGHALFVNAEPAKSNWDKCIYFPGPYRAMAASVLMVPSPFFASPLARKNNLCALARTGLLECSDIVFPGWWMAANGPWQNWQTANSSTIPCVNGATKSPGTFLRPSSVFCPKTSPSACIAPIALKSFAISSCVGSGTYLTGVRMSDDVPVAWLVGRDSFDASPAANSTASASGLYSNSPVLPVDPSFPPVLGCMPTFGTRVFSGRSLNGSFLTIPEFVEQGQRSFAVTSSSSEAAGFRPVESLSSYMMQYTPLSFTVLVGPFDPFTYTSKHSYSGAQNTALGIRRDGMITTGIAVIPFEIGQPQPQANVISDRPLAVLHMIMQPAQDLLCASSMTLAPFRSNTTAFADFRCIGPFYRNGNSNSPGTIAGRGVNVDFFSFGVGTRSANPMNTLPLTSFRFGAISANGVVAIGLALPPSFMAGNVPCIAGGETCIAWLGLSIIPPPSISLGGYSKIFGVLLFSLDPVAALFWCATFRNTLSTGCLFFLRGGRARGASRPATLRRLCGSSCDHEHNSVRRASRRRLP
jgi:hypothetical protein